MQWVPEETKKFTEPRQKESKTGGTPTDLFQLKEKQNEDMDTRGHIEDKTNNRMQMNAVPIIKKNEILKPKKRYRIIDRASPGQTGCREREGTFELRGATGCMSL